MTILQTKSWREVKPLLIGILMSVLLFFLLFSESLLLKSQVLKPLATPAQQGRFDSPAQFEQAVFKAIDRYRLVEAQKARARKEAVWQNAPLQTSASQHLYGKPDARFTLVEFSDFECPFCRSFHQTLKSLVDASQGLVNWEFKSLPLHGSSSQHAAQAAECVARL